MAEKKYNPLAAAEMSGEDNYNSIDGILNNGYKPSILDTLRDNQAKADEQNGGKPHAPAKTPEQEGRDR